MSPPQRAGIPCPPTTVSHPRAGSRIRRYVNIRHRAAAPFVRLALPLVVLGAIVAGVTGAHDLTGRRAPRPLSATRPAPAPGATPRAAAAPHTLYIANDDHSDYMWSGDDAAYRSAFPAMLEYYMNQAEATAANASDLRGRFNCDGTIWVWMYERARPAPAVTRLMDHVRAGDITLPLNPVVQLYGAMPAEAVLRGFLYGGDLERRFGVPLELVVPMENQTLPGGVASLWAGSGAKYAWKGICDCATKIDAAHRPRELYRFTGPDGQSVILKWNSMLWGNTSIGGYAEARDPAAAIDLMSGDPDFLARWPYDVAGAFGYGWDDLQSTTGAFLDAAAAGSDATRRVVVSNEMDFFQDVENRLGAALESWGKSLGNEWDLLPASMAEVSARVRRSVEKLRAAEALATVASLHDTTFMVGRTSARDSAMFGLGIYYEHSWSGGPGVSEAQRAEWQRSIERAISGYVDRLHADGVAALGAQIARPEGTQRWFVFNPLGWTRTDVADLGLPYGAFRVIDVATGAEVPAQAVTVDGQARTRILASDVPSVGYRVYELRSGTPATFTPSAAVSLPGMENTFYRVGLGAHGDLVSLVDLKDGGRELVAGNDGLFDLGSGSGAAELVESGPVSTTLQVNAGGSPAHTTSVTLYAAPVDRVDFSGLVTENFGDTQAWSSGFNLPGGTWRHEEVGMIARVARESDGGDYADQNARTDWLTLNHFADLSQSGRGVTLSSWDSPFFQVGNSTPTTLDATSTTLRALVGMQDDPTIGIANQGGDSRFLDRFALRTHGPWDPAAAMRFALEHQNPLVTGACTGVAGAPLPASQWSLLSVDDPATLLWALKPAQNGPATDMIARVWNVAPVSRTLRLRLAGERLYGAREVTHIEQDLGGVAWQPAQITDDLASQQMKSWRLQMSGHATYVPPGTSRLGMSVTPNPVVIGTTGSVQFLMPVAGHVHVRLFDVGGRRVATLADEERAPGRNQVTWNTASLRPGVYVVDVDVAGHSEQTRVVVLR